MNGRLENKVAIVTGGGTGIGEAICLKFAREGAKSSSTACPTIPLEDVADAIRNQGGEAIAFAADVSDEAQARACVDEAIACFGKLDVLVNNAGVLLVNAETDDFPIEKFDEHLRCNVQLCVSDDPVWLPDLRNTRGDDLERRLRGRRERSAA